MSFCHSLATHVNTCDRPATFDPRIGALASRQALVTPWDQRVLIVLRPWSPPIASTAQSDCVLQCPSVSCTPPPLGQLPRAVCAGLFSALCDPTSLLISPLASHLQRPRSSRYSIPTQHSFPLTRQVDMRVLCVVHLTQDRFPCRSSCRLRVGKAAKVVAPAPCSETKCYAPAERCGVAQYFGQRETRSNNIPKEKITSSANRTD